MTLEDFFTLTEMREGLTAPARVKELINVLQKDKHNTVKNDVYSNRQWSTVARTIAATVNKDCLALFLQLDGLCYFDTWLKHGQKCLQETGDGFMEEAMIELLGAIEKLHKDEQKPVISDIMLTVKDLLSNKSSRVQDRARSLYSIWKQNSESNAVYMDVDKDKAVSDNLVGVNENCNHDQPECSLQDISTSRVDNNEEKNLEPASSYMTPTVSPEIMQTEVVVDLALPISDKDFGHASINDGPPNTVQSDTLNLVSETRPDLGNRSMHQLEATTGIKSPGSAVPGQRTPEGQSDVASSNEHDEAKQMPHIRSSNNLGVTETSFCVDSTNSVESKVGDNNEKDVDVGKEDPCINKSPSGDVRKELSEGNGETFDSRPSNPCTNLSAFDSTASANVLQGSPAHEIMAKNEQLTAFLSEEVDTEANKESNVQNFSDKDEVDLGNEDPTTNISSKEDRETIDGSNGQNVPEKAGFDCENEVITTYLLKKEETEAIEKSNGQNVSDEIGDLTVNLSGKEDSEAIEGSSGQNVSDEDEVVRKNDYDLSMSGADVKHSVAKKSDFDMFDPLEVARQVAMEVEREVDCREPSFSSSERMSGDGKVESSDYLKEKNIIGIHCSFNDVSTGPNHYAVGGKDFVQTKNIQRKNCTVNIEPTESSEMAQEKEHEEDNNVCGFDLNKDVLSDIDADNLINPVTTPNMVVSASRDVSTSGLPLSALQIEGTVEWKGYAEASAFCPPSTCKISKGESSTFASGSSTNLFRRKEYLDFDLNVAEGEDKLTDFPPTREIPNSTRRSSENCSFEASPKKSDLLQLDLNCVSDNGDAPVSYWRKEERVLPHYNGQLSPSASSSSSSMQPALKKFDLNDQPSPFTEFLHPALTVRSSTNVYTSVAGGFKTDESVISLMGSRVEVRQKDNVPQTIPLFNGSIGDPAADASMTRNDGVMGSALSLQYAHSFMYGYNGPLSGPTVPYSSAIYGHGGQIPFMVDSRGTPVAPRALSPVPALPPSFPQPLFFESLAASPADSNGLVPTRHGLDLNLGVMTEGRSRDVGNMLQLFNPGQGISKDEQMRAYSQAASSSGVGGKRKEPDGGWDPSAFNYKHHQPPWK